MIIPYHTASFIPTTKLGKLSAGAGQLHTTIADLCRCAATVGKAPNAKNIHGYYSVQEIAYRTSLIKSSLIFQPGAAILKSPAYKDLDPTEKGFVSYSIGMTLAKLFAEQAGVPWLLHFDRYIQHLQVQAVVVGAKGQFRRPDLFGRAYGLGWVLWEAKGRSNGFEQQTLNDAKAQVQNIRRIFSQTPYLLAASQSYFDNDVLNAELLDPDPPQDTGYDILGEAGFFLPEYYRPILDFIAASETRILELSGRRFILGNLGAAGVELGLDEVVYTRLLGHTTIAPEDFPPVEAARDETPEMSLSVGMDGIIALSHDTFAARDRHDAAPRA